MHGHQLLPHVDHSFAAREAIIPSAHQVPFVSCRFLALGNLGTAFLVRQDFFQVAQLLQRHHTTIRATRGLAHECAELGFPRRLNQFLGLPKFP
ncbi:hypothetical protein PsorP6_013787 [Peronosclerospora sorghi]|uniref:Uncharacterized protein n=1 Tax=Peronosclerospora sorghi TaxID=230839 RepID=A0ACC0VI35_9STRA|nr:hypothetical protein PsorP6_013787 [Peronosclerospora sorghi]